MKTAKTVWREKRTTAEGVGGDSTRGDGLIGETTDASDHFSLPALKFEGIFV